MGLLMMSKKDCQRLKVINAFHAGYMTRGEAANELNLSQRQITRIRKRYQECSDQGIVRKKRTSKGPRCYDRSYVEKILELVKTQYADFGPTLIAEKLKERHDIVIAKETLRRWMHQDGIRLAQQRRLKKVHPLRQRRSCLGELVQIDGSYHAWFEERAPECCLLVFIDDATGRLLLLKFVPSESHTSYAQSFYEYLELHGKPQSIYTDKHSVFSVNRKEMSADAAGVTALNQSLQELGIESILAHSPQAKGRVERANKTLQDRLVKELRLRNISSLEHANAYLPEFIAAFNHQFAVQPLQPDNKHTPLSDYEKTRLPLVLSYKQHRTVSKSLTVQFKQQHYQLQVEGHGYRLQQDGVMVCLTLDDEIVMTDLEGHILPYLLIPKLLKAPAVLDAKELAALPQQLPKPACDHPWRLIMASLHQSHYRAYSNQYKSKRAI